MLSLDRVELSVGGARLIGPLSLDVPGGQVTTVMGASGSGKSSLLAFVSGTLAPEFESAGRVTVDGEDLTGLPPERRRIGLLFQDDLLFPHLTVAENLAFGLPASITKQARRDQLAAALDEAELGGFGPRDPATLSGGQRARIALMRTLLSAPRALLLDEPFGKLDAELKGRIRRFVFDHATRRELPVLMVTHDAEDATAAGGPVIRLDQPLD